MKTTITLAIIASVGLTACAMQPSVKSANPATVQMQFKSENNKSVMTFWRPITPENVKGNRFMVGVSQGDAMMNADFPAYRPNVTQLDPGTYYLDSFQSPVSSKPGVAYCVSQSGHYLTRDGWDNETNKPLYMSFTVKEGQVLTLPTVQFDAECNPTITGEKPAAMVLGTKFQK